MLLEFKNRYDSYDSHFCFVAETVAFKIYFFFPLLAFSVQDFHKDLCGKSKRTKWEGVGEECVNWQQMYTFLSL